jgi:hypothetical protein
MAFDLVHWFKLFTLPPGRRLFAMRALLPVARRYDFAELTFHLEKAIAYEEKVLALDVQWRRSQATSKQPADSSTATPASVSFEEVRKARARGQDYMLSAAALILGKYYESTPEAGRARGELMASIMEQHEIVHAYLRARRKVRDIDPDTGEITDEVDLEQPEHLEIDPPPASA